jgi:hypothetical protein
VVLADDDVLLREGIGYLLKSRVTDAAELIDALSRIARGGSVVDHHVS